MLTPSTDDQEWGDELRRRRCRGQFVDLKLVPKHVAVYAMTGMWPAEYRPQCQVDVPEEQPSLHRAWALTGPIRRRLIAFRDDIRRRGTSVSDDNPRFDDFVRTIEDNTSSME